MGRRIRSMAEITCGIVLLVIGLVLALPGVPGPGIPVILGGLFILRKHFRWVNRLTRWIEEKAHAIKLRRRVGRNVSGERPAPE